MRENMKLSDYLLGVGRPVAYYPKLRRITGSTNATIFLCQFIYWTGKEEKGDGWIYKTSAEIEEETGLSYKEQANAREKLRSAGLLLEKNARLEHQMYFKIDLDALNGRWGTDQEGVPELTDGKLANTPLVSSLIGTTENTTENTSPRARLSKEELLKNAGTDWQIKAGLSSEDIAGHLAREQAEKDRAILYEKCMGYGSLPFWTDKGLERLLKFLLTKTPEEIKTFAEWSKRPYAGLNPVKARQYPNLVIECWDQAFSVEKSESEIKYYQPEDESKYVPPPPRDK
jgi:hypothetical protein